MKRRDGALEAIPVNAILNTVGAFERTGHPNWRDEPERRETLVALAVFEAHAGCVLS